MFGQFLLYVSVSVALKTKCLRKLLRLSYVEGKTNDRVCCKVNSFAGPQEPLLELSRDRNLLAWFRHVACHNSLSKTILQGTLEGGGHHGQQRKCWMDNIKEWTSLPVPDLLTMASCKKKKKKTGRGSSESSLKSSPDN